MPQIRGLSLLAAAALVLATPRAGAKEDRISKLSEVVIGESEDEVLVRIQGTRAPDFTSFTMHDPYRVVVDWAGSALDGVAKDQKHDRGLVRRITTKQFNSESEKISRVTVQLAVQTSYRVETDGKNVVVRFEKTEIPPEQPAEPVEANAKEAQPAYITELLAQPLPQGPLTEPKNVPAPPVEPAPIVIEDTPPVTIVIAPPPPPDPLPIPPPEPAAVEVVAAPTPAKVALAKVEPAKVEPAKVTLAKLDANNAAMPVAPTSPQVVTLGAARPKRPQTAESSPPPVRLASNAKDKVAPPAEPASPAKVVTAIPLASFDPTEKAQGVLLAQNTKAKTKPTRDFDPGPRVMKYIGFRSRPAVSEVFIRCDGKARYEIVEQSEGRVVLELMDTSIKLANNQRALDTRFFPGAVTKVQAQAGALGTRVVVDLREPVPFEVTRVGSTIKLHFQRPTG